MKEPVTTHNSVAIDSNQRMDIIVNSKSWTIIGPWHFDDTFPASKNEKTFTGDNSFNYLVNVENVNYLVHPDDFGYISNLVHTLSNGKSHDFHIKLISSSGEQKIIHGFGKLVKSNPLEGEKAEPEIERKVGIPIDTLERLGGLGYWTVNYKTNSLFFSDQVYSIYGLKPNEYASRSDAFSKYVHPDDIQEYQARQRERKITPGIQSLRFRIVRPDKMIRWLEERTELLKKENGELVLTGIVRDITDLIKPEGEKDSRRAPVSSSNEQKLQEALLQSLFQKAFDAIPQLIWVSDPHGNFLWFNDRWHAYTGLNYESFSGYQYIKSGLIHPSQLREVKAKWEHSLKSRTPYYNETLLKNSDGEYFWHLDSIWPIKNDSGELEFWVGSLTDVNEEFSADKNIKENNDLLAAIFNSSINGIQVLESIRDENTNKIIDFEWKYFNNVARDFFSSEDLTDKRLTVQYPNAITSGLLDQFKEVILKGEAIQLEHFFAYQGVERWMEISAVKLEDSLVATFHDITLRKQAELEVGESRHFIQQIANSTPDIIYVIDLLEQKIVYANGKVEEYLGYDAKSLYELGPAVFQKLMHPEDFERRMEHIKNLATLDDNETRVIEVRFKSVSGQWKWFRIRDTLFKRAKDGSVWQTIGIAQDIDDLRTAKDRVYIQHQIDRQAEKIGQIGNWQWNLSTNEVIWGENLYYLLELDPALDSPSLKAFISYVHISDQDFFYREIERLKKNPAPGPIPLFYFRVNRKGGGMRHLRAAAELIERNGERLIIGTVRDVTQEIINEKEIKERINFIETLVESTINRIAVVDQNLRYLIWNKKCEEIYGLKKSQVLGKTMREVYPKIDEKPVVLKRIQRSLKGEFLHFPSEKSFRSSNYYESFYIPLKNEQDEVYAVLNIVHDITDKVQSQHQLVKLNESLKQKNHELKAMNEQLSTFAFVASHDLREPLRKIQVFSNTIMANESKNLSDRGKEYFSKILSSIARMNDLIDDILSFSRIHGHHKDAQPVDLNEIVAIVKSDLSELIKDTGAVIHQMHLPKYAGNRSQMIQLFQNLLSNAIKFQSPGVVPQINIRSEQIKGDAIEHPASKPEKQYLLLEISDNGIGFEEQYQNKIFQMFQRLHVPSQYTGTGMGLAICKKVLENHNGFIIAKSKLGQGSVFSCFLPLE